MADTVGDKTTSAIDLVEQDIAKVLRDLVADERSMAEAIRLPEYKCEWIDKAADTITRLKAALNEIAGMDYGRAITMRRIAREALGMSVGGE